MIIEELVVPLLIWVNPQECPILSVWKYSEGNNNRARSTVFRMEYGPMRLKIYADVYDHPARGRSLTLTPKEILADGSEVDTVFRAGTEISVYGS